MAKVWQACFLSLMMCAARADVLPADQAKRALAEGRLVEAEKLFIAALGGHQAGGSGAPARARTLAVAKGGRRPQQHAGLENPDLAETLENYAVLLRGLNRAQDAKRAAERALTIRARNAWKQPAGH